MLPEKLSRKTTSVFFLLALVFSLLDISKVFIDPHCLAFDSNDDANHTFINLQQWRRIASQGEWPMMNVYNNFGTPLIGDVITYPLSPLAVTYAFLPGPKAMTVNRVLIGFLTLLVLFIFYQRRFPKVLSIGLGLSTFYSPGFIWHSAHHHFQLTLLILTCFILLQETFTQRMSAVSYLGMCALSIIMFLGVSLNVVMILCLMIIGYQFFLSGSVNEKSFWIVVSALVCGLVAVFPDTWLFTEAAGRSIRKLAEYPVASIIGPNKIFTAPIVAASIYTAALFREKRTRDAWLILCLGVIPFGIVLFSRVMPLLWQQIPLLGATDVVRLTWGAGIFLMMGVGGLLLRWLKLNEQWRLEIFLCFLATASDAYFLTFRQEWSSAARLVLAPIWGMIGIFFIGWLLAGAAGRKFIQEKTMANFMTGFIGSAVVVFFLYYAFFDVMGLSYPKICHIGGRPSFSLESSQDFPMPKLLAMIPKNSRVAYNFNTILGLDLRGAREGIFGSGARSTIMSNADFGVRLFNKGLVQFDNYTGDYHFSPPWRANILQQLGIDYVVEQKLDLPLLKQGWNVLGQEEGVFLYQNPLPTSVVFLKNRDEITPLSFIVQGNGLDVKIPNNLQTGQQLIISLLGIPGWRAWIDGHESSFVEGNNKFLVLSVTPQDHLVRVRYEPIAPGMIFAFFLLALTIPGLVIITCRLRR